MPLYAPDARAQIALIPPTFGFLVSPPIVFTSLAESWDRESGTGVDGRYVASQKEVHGQSNWLPQDCFLSGTAGMTGRAFTQIRGFGAQNWTTLFHGVIQRYGIHWPLGNGLSGATAPEVVSVDADAQMVHATYVLRKGPPAWVSPTIAPDPPGQGRDRNYLTLEWGHQSSNKINIRLRIEWGQPIALDVSYDAGATWALGVSVARELGNAENALKAGGGEINVRVFPDAKRQLLAIEVGNGCWLSFAPEIGELPKQGKIRLVNGGTTCALWILPSRHTPIKLSKSVRKFGRQIATAGSAFVVGNALTNAPEGQRNIATLTSDGSDFRVSVQADLADAGEGEGSSEPPRLSDISIVIPAVWSDTVPGVSNTAIRGASSLPLCGVREVETWDVISREYHQSAVLEVDNSKGQYTGMFANLAVSLQASMNLGGTYFQRMTGVTDDEAAVRLQKGVGPGKMLLPVTDCFHVMDVPLDEDCILDGWCVWNAFRFLAEKGNIHPSRLRGMPPPYIPPGATSDAPYGPAGYDCPYPILPKGTGNLPRLKFPLGTSVLTILRTLVADFGGVSTVTGRPTPCMMAFDPWGNLWIAPWDVMTTPINAYYSDTGLGTSQIMDIEVSNSAAPLRTETHFFGLDGLSNELLYAYRPSPPLVQLAKGYRSPWVERNARYASAEYLDYISQIAALDSSTPSQTIRLRVLYNPAVHAGERAWVSERFALGRTGLFLIEQIISDYRYRPDGVAVGYSDVFLRSVNEIA